MSSASALIPIYKAVPGKIYKMVQRLGKPTDEFLGQYLRMDSESRGPNAPAYAGSSPIYVFKKDGIIHTLPDEYPSQKIQEVSPERFMNKKTPNKTRRRVNRRRTTRRSRN